MEKTPVADVQTAIPTPLKLKLRRIRYSLVPAVTFVLSASLAGWLWSRHAAVPQGLGEVNVVPARVAAADDGRLIESDNPPRLYERVTKDQIVARLDSGHLQKRQEEAQAELERLGQQLEKVQKQVEAAEQSKATSRPDLQALKQQEAALREAKRRQEAVYLDWEKRVRDSFLRSPADGTVSSIRRTPGEFVRQGDVILTITPDDGAFIVSYVRPGTRAMPKKDQTVLVGAIGPGGRRAVARVQEVGTQVEPVPEHQLVNAKRPEWGIPVRIGLPDPTKLPLRPGELVTVNFRSDEK